MKGGAARRGPGRGGREEAGGGARRSGAGGVGVGGTEVFEESGATVLSGFGRPAERFLSGLTAVFCI